LGLTYSRGGWLSLALALIILSIGERTLLVRMIFGITAFVAYFTVRMVREREFLEWTNVLASFGRGTYWKEALTIIRDRPIFGFGLNTYSIVGRRFNEGWGGYPHNCYLHMTAEIGIVGLMSFVWIAVALYKVVFAAMARVVKPFERSLLKGALAGFSGFLIHSAFDTFFYSVQLGSLMWIMMGMLVSLSRLSGGEDF
jgi:O-antigen ligase